MMMPEDLLEEGEEFCGDQKAWAVIFYLFYNPIAGMGRGAGKTWFLKRVVKFILRDNPDIKHMIKEEVYS